MSILGFDLETVPLVARAQELRHAYGEDPAAFLHRLEEEAKAGVASIEGSLTERVKEASLNPRLGRILAAGMATSHDRTKVLYAETEAEEAELVRELWSVIERAGVVLTFNGQGFDLPFLRVRSWILGVPIPVPAAKMDKWMKRFTHWGGHVDLRGALGHWGAVRGTLDEWLETFGLPTKPMHGGEVYAAFLRGEHDRIREYAGADAAALFLLYDRVLRDISI